MQATILPLLTVFSMLSLAALAAGCSGVPAEVHCKFVTDVNNAATNYAAAAAAANNPGWQAEAKELQRAATSEKQTYCSK